MPSRHQTSNADAEVLVQLGELSSRRNVLKGASLAPGFDASLRDLQDRAKRPLLFQRQERGSIWTTDSRRVLFRTVWGWRNVPAVVFDEIVDVVRLGRLSTAKTIRGVRSVVAGDLIRSVPFSAPSPPSLAPNITHALQTLTDQDPCH